MDAGGELYGGPCRLPLLPLSPDQKKVVLDEFVKEGFLKM